MPGGVDFRYHRRLLGRYGSEAAALVEEAAAGELQAVPGTGTLWAELRWAARHDAVVRLEDLLLRRVRLGLLLPGGGRQHLERRRAAVQPVLGWDDRHWSGEVAASAVNAVAATGCPLWVVSRLAVTVADPELVTTTVRSAGASPGLKV